MIAIIDYDAGNIKSVEKAFEALGEKVCITDKGGDLLEASGIVLPGVGAFGDAMEKLTERGLPEVLKEAVRRNIPFLGICLGLQLLFENSEESPGVEGLKILKGKILRIPRQDGLKVPHMGWNSLSFPHEGRLFQGLPKNPYVYFVHSYYLQAEDESIVTAETDYGVRIHASVEQKNVFACQFHLEKSSFVGLSILRNFIGITKEGK